MQVCISVYGGQRPTSGIFPQKPSHFWETVSHGVLDTFFTAGLADWQAQRVCLGLQEPAPHLVFLHGCWESSSGPYCVSKPLPHRVPSYGIPIVGITDLSIFLPSPLHAPFLLMACLASAPNFLISVTTFSSPPNL